MSGMDRLSDDKLKRMADGLFNALEMQLLDDLGSMARELLAHRRASQSAPAPQDADRAMLIKELSDAARWRRLPDNENQLATAVLFERAVAALSAAPAPVGFGMYGEYTPITVGAGTTVKTPAPSETCTRCMGNGEIVTDWDAYLHSPNDATEDAVADCPDCGGTGHAVAAPAPSDGLREAVPLGLVEALRSGRQADMDGVMVTVSRQACEMAADILSALSASPAQEGEPRHD